MDRSEDSWIELHNAFNPNEVLVGGRSEELYCDREHNPFDNIRLDFRDYLRSGRPPIAFFTGHRGSGKSSMLFRLINNFKDDYFVVYFDIQHNLDSSRTNQIDLLYLLGLSIFQVAKNEGIKPDVKHADILRKSIHTISKTENEKSKGSLNIAELAKNLVCFGAGMLAGNIGEKLAQAALKPFTLTSGVSVETARKREIEPQVQEVINNINLIIADVQTKAKKKLLVIVDGLDKLQSLEQTDLIFLKSSSLLGPLCRIIYTVPMLIFNTPGFAEIEEEGRSYLLPNVKLYEKADSSKKYDRGYETLRKVVDRRLKSLDMEHNDVFESEILDMLIQKSGGVMRFLIELIENSFTEAELLGLCKVNRQAAQKAIDNRAATLTSRLTIESKDELKLVHKEKLTSNGSVSGELLHGLLIVAYRNKTTWFDVHPILWDELK
ncbi:MAG: ATP-binding protein [Candidatus Brocadiaceae bacterium]|nr:ATP-binding protein [Candidatus Brocadiaceae bacterium]